MTLTAAPPRTVYAGVLANLCADAKLPPEVINTEQEPGGAYWRQPGIWIDADSPEQYGTAIAVLAEAIGRGAAAEISGLVVSTRGGAYGATASVEARLPGWTIGSPS